MSGSKRLAAAREVERRTATLLPGLSLISIDDLEWQAGVAGCPLREEHVQMLIGAHSVLETLRTQAEGIVSREQEWEQGVRATGWRRLFRGVAR